MEQTVYNKYPILCSKAISLAWPWREKKLKSLNPEPLLVGLLPENPMSLGSIQTHFGNLRFCMSYQQRLTNNTL